MTRATLPPRPPAPASAQATGWQEVLSVFVPGVPAPGGSKRAMLHRHTGRVIVMDDAKRNKPWRQSVEAVVAAAITCPPIRGAAISLSVLFLMPRPKGHYGSGKNAGKLKPTAPGFHTVKPDATKLLRALEDACTGILWADDAAITEQDVKKLYANDQPGAFVNVSVWEPRADGGERKGGGRC